jgi:hypothetical protein
MKWIKSNTAPAYWDSEDGLFRITEGKAGSGYLLTMYDHEGEDGGPLVRRFASVQEARDWAENS